MQDADDLRARAYRCRELLRIAVTADVKEQLGQWAEEFEAEAEAVESGRLRTTADGGEEVRIVTARIDPARIAEARGMVPSLQHDRTFTPPALIPRPLAAE